MKSLFTPNDRFIYNPNYRADIDGLRALAVISVILFHLNVPGFGGGYVGVDVFFVISGFLITQLIRREMAQGTFRFARFYERRLRRLAPSFIVMLLLSSVFAALMLSPADLVNFSESLAASLLVAANVFFYVKSGYFTNDVDNKPLLHVWSLSAEEQFYLFWPILLLLIVKYLPNMGAWMALAALGAISLGVAIYLSGVDAQAAFYLIPSRIFEFLIGAALLWIPPISITRKALLDFLLLAGIGMILAAVFCYTKQTPFPSYYALLPCMGTAFVIAAGRDSPLRFAINNRALAYAGRISYELYLFHWPVIIFYKYLAFEAVTGIDTLIMLALTILLSLPTYHFIGFPLRHGYAKTAVQRHNFIIGCGVFGVALLFAAFSMKTTQGWPWRIPQEVRLYMRDPGEFHKTQFGGAGFKDNTVLTLGDETTPPQFLLFGDSFAAQYGLALSDFLKAHHRSAYAFFHTGCLMMPHVISHDRGEVNPECRSAFAQVQKVLQNNTLPVIASQSWSSYKDRVMRNDGTVVHFSSANNDDYYQFIIDGIDQLHTALGPNHKLVVVGISPGIHEQKAIARCFQIPAYLPNKCASSVAFPEATQLNGQEFNVAEAKYIAAHPEVTFMNPREAVCSAGMCHAIDGAKIFYSDYSHFTKDGAAVVIDHFSDLLLSLHP